MKGGPILMYAKEGISTIKNLVGHEAIDESYELTIFRHASGIIEDLLSNSDDAIAVALESKVEAI